MAPDAVGGVLDHLERFGHQLDLLDRPLVFGPLGRADPVGRIDRTSLQAERDPLIDLLRSKRWPLVLGMSRLAANPSLGLLVPSLLLGFDNVTGGRFGGIAGVFLGGRQGLG
jgi:hypothetical protein